MSSRAGYQPLSQSVEEADVSEGVQPSPSTQRLSRRLKRATLRPGHIDLKKLDNAFKRWTESIAQKVKRKKKVEDNSRKEIWRSVFEPQVAMPSGYVPQVKTLEHEPPMTQADFDRVVQSVRSAISEGINPKMITKGSSGSYFARAKVDGRVQTVAVFKPKDEEPYGRLNPKTTKWIHRQFRWIIPFGRSCLIPNLSYISEAAASLLDQRLELHIVPRTQLVSLSSPVFFYDWLDRNAAKKGKPLPDKIGSMQYFLHGFQDASDFLRKYPWPGRLISDTFDDSTHRTGNLTKRFLSTLKIICGKTGEEDLYDEVEQEDERVLYDATEEHESRMPFYWSLALQQSFREELEKLVILDYLMLNTDRGADNYMVRYCEGEHEKSLVDVAPTRSTHFAMPSMSELRRTDSGSHTSVPFPERPQQNHHPSTSSYLSNPQDPYTRPHIHIAAIDNSLSFPHEHPQGWRSYTYGWLYLPVSVIGRPFSEKTRSHFLPLLTSKTWWEETTFQLRNLFAVDPDFHPKMFNRQLAVIKGQAWNIVQSLRHSDEGPLELTRRTKALVWDDETELTEETQEVPGSSNPHQYSPQLSVNSVPLPRRTRSQSSVSDFPPPIRRTSTEASRPVPFAAKFQRVHPGTTGVTVLEHLERLDAVEASLKRLGGSGDDVIEEEEEGDGEGEVEVEVDVGESLVRSSAAPGVASSSKKEDETNNVPPASPFSPPGSPLRTVPEVPTLADSMTEEDLIAMSKSMSHAEVSSSSSQFKWASNARREPTHDWMRGDEGSPVKKTVIVERLETITKQPLCSCW